MTRCAAGVPRPYAEAPPRRRTPREGVRTVALAYGDAAGVLFATRNDDASRHELLDNPNRGDERRGDSARRESRSALRQSARNDELVGHKRIDAGVGIQSIDELRVGLIHHLFHGPTPLAERLATTEPALKLRPDRNGGSRRRSAHLQKFDSAFESVSPEPIL